MLKSPISVSPSGGRLGPRKTKAPGVTRHNCVMSYLNRRDMRCARWPSVARGRKSAVGNDRPELIVRCVITQWPGRKEAFRIISRLKRVTESFINKWTRSDFGWHCKGAWSCFLFTKCSVMSRRLKKHTLLFPYLWQESKLNTNQYFVWSGEISLKITFVRAPDHRGRRQRRRWWFDDDNPLLVQSAYLIWERGHKKQR